MAIPNFVDVNVFRPSADEKEKRACREQLGIPADAFVVGTAAAVKKHHKRIDYLLEEFGKWSQESGVRGQESGVRSQESGVRSRESGVGSQGAQGAPFLLVAGSKQKDSGELIELAQRVAPGRCRILLDFPHERMPELYRAMDVFVLTSLFEMMPIAVLEALASGLPVIANAHPVLEWMVGAGGEEGKESHHEGTKSTKGGEAGGTESKSLSSSCPSCLRGDSLCGGACIDMGAKGALTAFLSQVDQVWLRDRGRDARRRAERMFSVDAVIGEYVAYYARVMEEAGRGNG